MPTFPLFVYDTRHTTLDLMEDEGFFAHTSPWALTHRAWEGDAYYDAAGTLWTIADMRTSRPVTSWMRLMSTFGFNPILDAETVWREERAYTLDELKDCFFRAGLRDARVAAAESFEELVAAFHEKAGQRQDSGPGGGE